MLLEKTVGKDTDKDSVFTASAAMNDGMGPYGRPPENGFPLPEEPLYHGHSWHPSDVDFIPYANKFTDGYKPGPGDKPRF
jgi:hypothetical protein